MAMVKIHDLCKNFSSVKAVNHVSLEVENGEMLCLLGPSGCGKTTLLRLLSGFLEADEGEILMNGQNVTYISPERRPTSLVFQNYALFPHLDVYENIAFGLRVQKKKSAYIEEEVMRMLEIVGLTGKERRAISQLSGGQQQRVALARALIMKPLVLLLDEPLSNLDAKLRLETRQHIRHIQKSVNITSIYVTHDQEEALVMADRVAVMRNGRIEQLDTPRMIYSKPVNYFVADFIGKSNFLHGVLAEETLTLPSGRTVVVKAEGASGQTVLSLRPESIFLAEPKELVRKGYNALTGKIADVVFQGESTSYKVDLGEDGMVQVFSSGQSQPYQEKEDIMIYWAEDSGVLLDPEPGLKAAS
jgi:ABC-type Fe3+/spermidine/putrescine transport system ATPase subunit